MAKSLAPRPRPPFRHRLLLQSSKSLSKSRNFFADFITQTLFLRPSNSPFHTFRPIFDYRSTGRRQIEVDSWVRYAIDAGVTVLNLDFDSSVLSRSRGNYGECSDDDLPDDAFGSYHFHFCELRGNCSVRVLKLVDCRIVLPKLNNRGFLGDGYTSLCSVSLDRIYITDEQFYVLVSSLVNLEYLSISGFPMIKNFKIYSQKLKELEMGIFMVNFKGPAVGSFEISCPSLQKISFDSFPVKDYCAKDLSSLIEARVEFSSRRDDDWTCWWELMKLLTAVKRLITVNMCLLREDWIEFLGTEDFSEKSSAFKNLKYLELETGYTEYDLLGIASFLEVCPVLESLVLDYCFEYDGNLSEEFMSKPFIVNLPSLKQVKMKNYKGTTNELFLVESLKKHSVVLREITACGKWRNITTPFSLEHL